jgi:hypothetical protein
VLFARDGVVVQDSRRRRSKTILDRRSADRVEPRPGREKNARLRSLSASRLRCRLSPGSSRRVCNADSGCARYQHRVLSHPGSRSHRNPRYQHSAGSYLAAGNRPDLSKFRSAEAFASWLGLGPDNRISGGKILSVRTRDVQNRAKLGAPKAITVTAHKLARILYDLLTTGHAYQGSLFAERETQYQQRNLFSLHARARALGYQLIPLAAPA